MRRLRDVLGLAIRQANYKERHNINASFPNDDELFTSSEDDDDWQETEDDDDENQQSIGQSTQKSNTPVGVGHNRWSKMNSKNKCGQKQRCRLNNDDDDHF
jgi:hypothetical protein